MQQSSSWIGEVTYDPILLLQDLALALMSAVRKGQIPNTAFLLSVGAEVNVRIADTSVGRSLKHREPDAFQKVGRVTIHTTGSSAGNDSNDALTFAM